MTNRKLIRVLHIVGGMNRGGVETWLMNILRQSDRSQLQMDFMVHTTQECAYDKEIKALGSKIIPCPNPRQPWRYARNFQYALKEYGPYDVVHSHVYWFSGYVVRLAHQANIPQRIVHIYPVEDWKGQSFVRRVYRRLMAIQIENHATGILADSQAALAAFTRVCQCTQQSKKIVYPVVDLSPFKRSINRHQVRQSYGLPLDLPIILYVARFFPHKNHVALLEIARRLNATCPVAYFVMAGSHGPTLSQLQILIQERSDVSLLTGIKDISDLMLTSDLFVLPSLNEGFGIVAIEAQAAGLPVVATDLPSIAETLAPALRPLQFTSGDLETAITNIKRILSDSNFGALLTREGLAWVERFSLQSSANELFSFYSSHAQH